MSLASGKPPSYGLRKDSLFAPAIEYLRVSAGCNIPFWDVMRERDNQYRDHIAETVPFLEFEVELVLDGCKLQPACLST